MKQDENRGEFIIVPLLSAMNISFYPDMRMHFRNSELKISDQKLCFFPPLPLPIIKICEWGLCDSIACKVIQIPSSKIALLNRTHVVTVQPPLRTSQ